MSLLVLHMDKFKKEAVRGIQSHNLRERESRSNPDIDYARSSNNYELCENSAENYMQAIQNRIDDLLLPKAVRKDAVYMCGLVVSSDSAFFKDLSNEEVRRFFEESKAFLTDFVGGENVISAMVHMDETTPHMHFLHVPVTKDGRLSAKDIYTSGSLKRLQADLPAYLQSRGFKILRGIEQKPGSVKKHLDTLEYKQQQEALNKIKRERDALEDNYRFLLGFLDQRERELKEKIAEYQQQAEAAEKILQEKTNLPEASLFNYKSVVEKMHGIIEEQKKALAVHRVIRDENERLRRELEILKKELARQQAENTEIRKQSLEDKNRMEELQTQMTQKLEAYQAFIRQPGMEQMYEQYLQGLRDEEVRRQEEERQREEQAKREREIQRQQCSRGMRMR